MTVEQGKPLTRAVIEERLTALLQELRVDHLRQSPALACRRESDGARAAPGVPG